MNELSTIQHERSLTAPEMRGHVNLIQEVMKSVMKENVHFGIIPGCDKPSLYKPGAEVLCATFRIAPTFEIDDLSTEGNIRYRVRCVGSHQGTQIFLGQGMGECSSDEEKYKWVKAYQREYDATPESRRRLKFGYNKTKREEYEVMQVRTEPADVANTILKMACKRAQIHMALNVTAASDIFAQDLEDMPEGIRENGDAESRPAQTTGNNEATITFGKNKGKKWSEIDAGYLKWCVDNATNPKFKDLAQAELDRRSGSGQTSGMNQSIVMASEQDIRLIRESAKAKQITVPEILEMFELDSMDKIRQIDVAPILKWVANPEEVPAKLAAF